MNQQQLIQEFAGYPLSTKSAVLRELLKAYEDDLGEDGRENNDDNRVNGGGNRDDLIAKRKEAVDKLRGIAAVPGKRPPTDEEWREERTIYLLEKYK